MRGSILCALIACSAPAEDAPKRPPKTTTSITQDTTTTNTTTSNTTTTQIATYDCAALPVGPLVDAPIADVFPVEDFAFDNAGHLICHDGANALVRYDYPWVNPDPFATTDGGGGGPASLRLLPNGDVVYANVDTGSLYRVTPGGATTVLYGALAYPTGIDIHSSGLVLIADLSGLYLIDADLPAVNKIVPAGGFLSPNGLTYNADYSRVYVGARDGIWWFPVDPDGQATGPAVLFEIPPNNAETLGMGVDACDNLYVLLRNQVLRYGPNGGSPDVLLEAAAGSWFTNLQWGSGVGGWDANTVYIIDRVYPEGILHTLDVGVPSKAY